MRNRLWIFGTIVFLLTNCDNKKKPETIRSNPPVEIKSAPIFNADTAYNKIEKQVSFGPRVPNTKPHIACGDYLIHQLNKYGCKVIVQSFSKKSFDGKQLELRNIIGSINPSATKRIILASHWDSRPFADQEENDNKKRTPIDGANDGASGVGILLEIARISQINKLDTNVGVDIIFFDGEDYGQPDFMHLPEVPDSWCLGSQYWAQNKHTASYQAYYGILLDMVGAKNAQFAMEGLSTRYAPAITDRIWNTAALAGYSNFFPNLKVESIIDDHYYINNIAKIPMVDIIEYNVSDKNNAYFGDYWHTLNDNMAVIDKNTLKAVGQTVLTVVYSEK
ncbi:MAG: M28 family peptidase [Bacteroidota bacterium]|nr:M28 family peptidase [Bacteroidota bacterium]